MLSSKNLLKPATGQPVALPDKDITWGCFYMTTLFEPVTGSVKTYGTGQSAIYAYQAGALDIREKIKTRLQVGEPILETNVGRILLNKLFSA